MDSAKYPICKVEKSDALKVANFFNQVAVELVAFGIALVMAQRSQHVHEFGIVVRKSVW